MEDDNTTNLFGITFMDVNPEYVTVQIRTNEQFTVMDIDMGFGKGTISLFTDTLDQAENIIQAFTRARVRHT